MGLRLALQACRQGSGSITLFPLETVSHHRFPLPVMLLDPCEILAPSHHMLGRGHQGLGERYLQKSIEKGIPHALEKCIIREGIFGGVKKLQS